MEINLPKGTLPRVDVRTKTRNVSLPFTFPDGTPGICVLIRVADEPWADLKDLKSVNINFYGEE